MPRLPDLNDLGARPVPVSRRSIASNPRAGAVGDALAGFGDAAVAGSQRLFAKQDREREKEDRLAYATGKSALLRGIVTVQQELESDPASYESWPTLFREKIKPVVEAASGLIRSKSDRALFGAEAELDLVRADAQIAGRVRERQVDAGKALTAELLASNEDTYAAAADDATRTAVIDSTASAINDARDKGYLSAEEAVRERQGFAARVSRQRVQTLVDAGDLDGARRHFEASKGFLSPGDETAIAKMLVDAEEYRDVLVAAKEEVSGFIDEAVVSPAPTMLATSAPALTQLVEITAISESGNRERDGRGRLVTSPAGAQGKMQVMPGTARQPGYDIRPWDGKSDEDRSRVGRELLAALVEKYDGDVAKAWAAYNWDSSGKKIDRLVSRHGDKWLDYAPAETQAYVRKNVAALGGGDVPLSEAGHVDLNGVYARIEARAAREGWTPEKTEKVKAQADREVARIETLAKRQEDDAYERAMARASQLKADLKDVSQLGADFYALPPSRQNVFRDMVEANNRPEPIEANGADAISLRLMPYYEPEKFKTANLAEFAGRVTPAELEAALTKQAQMRTAPPDDDPAAKWNPRQGIVTALNYGTKINAMKLAPAEEAAILSIMEAEAWRLFEQGGRKPLNENDYQTLFRSATRNVKTHSTFAGIRTGGGSERARYKLTTGNMPPATRERLTRRLRDEGLPVNEENLLRLYRLEAR